MLDVLGQVVNKSLVVAERDAQRTRARYGMLESLRQYAVECLERGGHEPGARARHATYFLELAEAAAPQLRGREQVAWLARLEQEHDNLRLPLHGAWSIGRVRGSPCASRAPCTGSGGRAATGRRSDMAGASARTETRSSTAMAPPRPSGRASVRSRRRCPWHVSKVTTTRRTAHSWRASHSLGS